MCPPFCPWRMHHDRYCTFRPRGQGHQAENRHGDPGGQGSAPQRRARRRDPRPARTAGCTRIPEAQFHRRRADPVHQHARKLARERSGEEILPISLDPNKTSAVEYLKGSFYWHFDGVIQDQPILASILSAKVLPPTGGNTEFCNTYAAYDDLSEEDKSRLPGCGRAFELGSAPVSRSGTFPGEARAVRRVR